MFDLITGKAQHIPRHQTVPILISTATQATALGIIALVSLVVVTERVPEIRSMMAFVAAPPPPAPPPPPPAPAPAAKPPAPHAVPTTGAVAAPVEAPSRIEPEVGLDAGEEGIPGGVEGGVPHGIVGGIVGGLPEAPPPPPPPPPAPAAPRGPVRVGGEIKAPALAYRVEPVYPPFALAANVTGTVILEATVDEDGRVQDARVISGQPLLEKAAMQAVRQWRYSPLMLNGHPEKFILTVVLTFSLQK